MRAAQKIAAVALVIGLGTTIYGIVRAGEAASAATAKARKAAAGQVVDQSALATARQLAQVADTPEEQELAKEALRLGDYELDLAFDIALRNADAHPVALSAEAKTIQDRRSEERRVGKECRSRWSP